MWIRLCEGGDLEIAFQYDEGLVALMKTLPERRWRKADKCWIVPREHAAFVVEALQPLGFIVEPGVMELAANPLAPASRPTSQDLTVAELNERAANAIEHAFSNAVWVVGELYDVSRARRVDPSGILRFSLVQRAENGKEVARVRAVLFGDARARIEGRLRRAGDPFEFADETPVRMRVRPTFYAPAGAFQVVVDELDVEYTLGDVARRREEVLRRLIGEGLYLRNPALPIPLAPLRVGLITRSESDAFHDVRQTLTDSGYAFEVLLADVRVQGRDAEPTILAALRWFELRANAVDVLLICRGGGSRVDLSAFDSEPIARAVAALSIPVVVGIGHEQDRSVLDSCARSVRTPVAAAEFLVEEVKRFERRMMEAMAAVGTTASEVVRDRGDALDRTRGRMAPAARNAVRLETTALHRAARESIIAASVQVREARTQTTETRHAFELATRQTVARERTRIQARLEQVRTSGREQIAAPRRELASARAELLRGGTALIESASASHESAARQIALAHPNRVLAMGYAILRKTTGVVVRSSKAVHRGETLAAQLADGTLSLSVNHSGPAQESLALDQPVDNEDEESV